MNCNCNNNGRIQQPIISVTPALGSTTSPYLLQVTINQRLCASVCNENTPVFLPQFDVLSVTNVGAGQYVVTARVQGAINFVQCGKSCGCGISQPINAVFSIPVASATVPTSVTISKGNTINDVQTDNCKVCGRQFVSDSFITLTVA